MNSRARERARECSRIIAVNVREKHKMQNVGVMSFVIHYTTSAQLCDPAACIRIYRVR